MSTSEDMRIAVLLLIFNRPTPTAAVMKSIRSAAPARLYVASDGPRSGRPEDVALVAKCRGLVLESVDWDCEVRTLFRDSNLGCRAAVSQAIDWFFTHEESGIILEDDCIPGNSFFPYCARLLDRYRDDLRVMAIGGTDAVGIPAQRTPDYVFSIYSLVWGWATWRRAWLQYNVDIPDWPRLRAAGFLKTVPGADTLFVRTFTRILDSVHNRRLDTWDFQWMLTVWKAGGLVALPTTNLVTNVGFGPDATHTYSGTTPEIAALPVGEVGIPLRTPATIEADVGRDRIIGRRWFGLHWGGEIRRTLGSLPGARRVATIIRNLRNTG